MSVEHGVRRRAVSVAAEDDLVHEAWDAFLEAAEGGDVNQSSGWGRVKRADGMEVHRLVLREGDVVVGGVQVLGRRLGRLGVVAYVPYGPVLGPAVSAADGARLVEELLEGCRRWRARALVVQPPEGGNLVAGLLRAAGLGSTTVDVAPSASLRLDLRRDPEELLAHMSRTPRKHIRRAQRGGVDVRVAGREDLPAFAELYERSAARHGFQPVPRSGIEALWDGLRSRGHVHLLLGAVDGIDVAGLLVTRLGQVVTARLQGFDPARVESGARPNDAVLWATLDHARSLGARWYDLGGIPRADAVALASAPDRRAELVATSRAGHKLGLGGVPVVYPLPLEHVGNPLLRTAYGALRSSPAWSTWRHRLEVRFRRGGGPRAAT